MIRGPGAILKRPDASQNSINIAGCQWLELRDLEITGGSAGIRIAKQGSHMAKFLLFEGLHIHHIGGVAITANNEGNTTGCSRKRNTSAAKPSKSNSAITRPGIDIETLHLFDSPSHERHARMNS